MLLVYCFYLSLRKSKSKASKRSCFNRFPGFRWPPRCEDDNPRDAVARNRSLTSGYSSVLPGLPFALSSFWSRRWEMQKRAQGVPLFWFFFFFFSPSRCSSAKSASQSSSDFPCPLPRYDFLARMTNQKLVKCPDFGAAAYPYLHVSDVAISQPHVSLALLR
ncbi:hypothetical protein HDV62DRAFT_330889 [Trichoderma sp. SZMC 28011]